MYPCSYGKMRTKGTFVYFACIPVSIRVVYGRHLSCKYQQICNICRFYIMPIMSCNPLFIVCLFNISLTSPQTRAFVHGSTEFIRSRSAPVQFTPCWHIKPRNRSWHVGTTCLFEIPLCVLFFNHTTHEHRAKKSGPRSLKGEPGQPLESEDCDKKGQSSPAIRSSNILVF